MSHMTRQEIVDLHDLMVARIKRNHGTEHTVLDGVNRVAQQLKREDGVASLQLRNFGRVMKHYFEPVKNELAAVAQFNFALDYVARGGDVQQAIRKARNATRESTMAA